MSGRPPLRVLRDPVQCLALGFGSGLAPRAPGTAGTLVALVPAWFMASLPLAAAFAIAAAALLAGIWICGAGARRLGRHDLGGHDNPAIVWDEIAAMLALSLTVPRTLFWYAIAFALFRLFDIVKPWPIREMDHRIAGGAGIMLDDVAAALYAAAVLNVLFRVLPVA